MLSSLLIILKHDMRLTLRQAFSWLTPLLFFVIVVCLFPLALGPDSALLSKVAPAIILLSLGNLFHHDKQEGHLDVLLLSPTPLTLIVLCKIFSHWVTHCLPLICLSPLLGLLLHLNLHEQSTLIITLLLGTPVFSLLGAIGAALTIGIRGHGLLLPILIMPLYIPVLIFGTGALIAAHSNTAEMSYFAIMGALILVSLAFAPLLTSFALRMGANQ
jgi:heme exporter protein B